MQKNINTDIQIINKNICQVPGEDHSADRSFLKTDYLNKCYKNAFI